MSKLRKEAVVAGSISKQVPKRAASALVLGSPLSSSSGEEDITMSMSSSSTDPSSAILPKPRPRPTSKLVSKPAAPRPKSTALAHSSSVNDVSTKDKNDEGSSSTSSTLASAPAPSNSITQRLSRVGKSIASKYSTLPLPPKSKDPASPKPTSSGLSQSSKGSSTIRMTPHQLQLQQQAQDLQHQIQLQKLLLEEQQKQLQNSQHTQQELELRLQQQNTEKQLQQQILEQQLLQQQLELEEQHREKQRQQARFTMHLHQMNQSGPVPSQYSVSARTYMNLFPFQQHHADKQANPSPTDFVQGPTFVAEFAYTPTQAVENFKDWRNSQWLLPHGFANQLDPLSVVPTFLPFYVFSLFSHSVCSGRVGYFKNSDDHTGGLFSMDFEFKDDFQKSNTQTQLHPNVLVYAPTTELVSTPDYESLQDISFWNLDEAILKPHTSLTARSLPSPTKPNTTIDIKMLRGIPIADAWTHARRKVVKNERYCSAQILKRDCRCDVVESVTTDTSFSHIVVKLIYLPVYVWTHAYQGETYHTVMNGQNGLIGGRRPFALKNSLDSCMKLFNGGEPVHEKTETIASIITGAELSRRDNFTDQHSSPYRHDAHYVVLPPSTQFLVVVATGWIRLANIAPRTERESREGEEREGSVTIVAQRRASHTTSPHELVIPPQEERTFSYKGAWCLGIVSGSHHHLVVRAVSPDAGHDKEDLLGML